MTMANSVEKVVALIPTALASEIGESPRSSRVALAPSVASSTFRAPRNRTKASGERNSAAQSVESNVNRHRRSGRDTASVEATMTMASTGTIRLFEAKLMSFPALLSALTIA